MRIAMLSYRSKPHVGGQGIYIRRLTRELVALGHTVEVFSGQPYPELDEGVTLTKVPSLDLYRPGDEFRNPRPSEYRDLIDVEEWLTMRSGAFPEPMTFSKRVVKVLKRRVDDFDIVFDNQTLATPLLGVEDLGLPLAATIHHPITMDRRIELAAAVWAKRKAGSKWRFELPKIGVWRWYSFLTEQKRTAPRLRRVVVPSESSKRDVVREFGVDPARIETILLGVDDRFVPPTEPRVPGRILAMASADAPLKGISVLLEAFAKLVVERDLELVLVTKPKAGGVTEKLIDRLGIVDRVSFANGLTDDELVALMGSAELACVPSLYEGFSLPTAELMACETPLVVSRAGAIPEVVGPDGLCADVVEPGDVGALTSAVAALLDDPARRAEMGAAGRRRVKELFSWTAVAASTAAVLEDVIAEYKAEKA
ncbi:MULTISPECIES: glycosyltransferase family 4 protein [unclassified Nocardioides]|uniref:glycosyltransferase family 4 protein n=1 Tax=unclassified Nocardioides TaxID=2615069 RepID=UPI0007032CFC|nr:MULTISPECIES: glycosyltransferase family 4 protein [unclassified Nocardioides]KRC58951.1 glycosyl transferase family 1 [Nocardioides sp. Root79]KRC76728.1 glycosyl transferase family 1 [Nocardioides sp. Root240]